MKCLLCGSNNLKTLNEEYKYNSDDFKRCFPKLRVIKCCQCDLVQVDIENSNDNDQKLFEYYSQIYRDKELPPKLDDRNTVLYQRGVGISKLIEKNFVFPKKRDIAIFEKGSGYGYNLMKLHEVFPQATLYTDEMDEHTEKYLKKINVNKHTVGQKKYDIIVISHVLEHLLNPIATIEEAYSMLKEDGLLYIEVPNSMNFVEPHITFWNVESFLKNFQSVLSDYFLLVDCYTTGYPMYYNNLLHKLFYKIEKRVIPEVKMVNKRTNNGVYLRALLKKVSK